MKTWWDALDARARAGMLVGTVVILGALAVAGWWLLRADRAVLFSDLKPQDAALMSAELEKLKVPYEIGDDGTALLVDKARVHATRLKLMGRDLPLNGAVGLELFNNTDFGMTEFAQKINYQRALQGELVRTILSLAEIRDARVHLALPEQGLFKPATARPKAAITLTLRHGQALRGEQVRGIQRLVAAAVAGLAAQEVTIVDHQGVAISGSAADEAGAATSGRLELKREMEAYLSRKAAMVLEQAFGPGQALASVDVMLDMDQVRVTTEDVIAAPEAKGGMAAGVLVKERESARDTAGPDAPAAGARGSSMQREVEYQAGRRVEQVVSQPGSIRRIHVVAVVRQVLDGQQQEQLRRLVAAAVGASFDRGDAVVVQSMAAIPPSAGSPMPPADAPVPAAPVPAREGDHAALLVVLALLAVVLLVALALAWGSRRRRSERVAVPLTQGQREAALRRVEAWLREERAAPLATPGLTASGRGTS